MAHVVALDAQRRFFHLERLLELLEGHRPARKVGRSPQAMALQLVLGVMACGGKKFSLASPFRDPDRGLAVSQA